MRIIIDTDDRTLTSIDGATTNVHQLYSLGAYDVVSQLWVKLGWNLKYPYRFTWLGRPIIQLPSDMLQIQEVIFSVKPDVIIETGIAHGGSLIFSASLCRLLGKGRVVGVDVEIRPHNRAAIEAHPMASLITMIEGSSTASDVVNRVRALVNPGESVLVILDSNHTRAHVADELAAYSGLVTPGSYIVATDGGMRDLHDVPAGRTNWDTDNPATAAEEFAKTNPQFKLERPAPVFTESPIPDDLTYWPSAWLRRL
ncbi:CmcI family methyltransferase [soil metagenome]